ncbi:type IV secretory system conjugative DNA transfer family protein [Candidatus Uhrbacteria bacterium]|nr:type IV secretory system conjugative DNA transfer family protein [Candidatus Uhrbacteria bacterium]
MLQFTGAITSSEMPSAASLTAKIIVGFYGGVLAAVYLSRFLLRYWYKRLIGTRYALLRISVPKESAEKKQELEKAKTLQEIQEDIAVGEKLMAAIGGLHAQRHLKPWFLGRSDLFSFEIVVKDGLIYFYIATQQKFKNFLADQIHGLYPNAQVEEIEDYNIFKPRCAIAGGYITLKHHTLFPLKTYRKLEADPLDGILNALTRIEKGDAAVIQYIARSARRRWRKYGVKVAIEMQKGKTTHEAMASISSWRGLAKFFRTKKKGPQGMPQEEASKRFLSSMEQEQQKAIQEKASKAGLDLNIRIVTASGSAQQATHYLKDIMGAFNQYNAYEYGNQFSKSYPRITYFLARDFIYRAFRERRRVTVGAEELASLWHLPLPTTETPNINWLLARKLPAPVNAPNEGLVLGYNRYRGIDKVTRIKREDRRRHLYIIGKSGVGKSVLIQNMAIQDITSGEGVCVVDPHGDLIEGILGAVPKERLDDVILFDPSDTERPVGLNMLEAAEEAQKDFAVQEMIAIFYKLFPPEMIGPMFEHNMRNAMLTLMSDPNENGTIAEIPRMFSDPEYQKYWVAKLRDPVVRAYWEKEVAKTSDFHKSEMLGYLISKVGRFVENAMMRNIIGQQNSGFNIREVMDHKKILLVNLAKGKVGEVNANLLGLIIVSKLQMAALGRADLPEEERHDFYLYIDEFQNFITDSIATILSEARKYRLDLIIAHQYMGQLTAGKEGGGQDTRIRDAVLGNAGTMASFRIGIEDAEVIAKEFAPLVSEYDLINAEKFTAYLKLLIDNQASKAFTLHTYPPIKGDSRIAEAIKQLSRLKYGRDRSIVESEILERSRLGEPERAAGPMVGERGL